MDKIPVLVGIDVAKHRLEVHLRPSGESFTIDYSEEEVAALVERLLPLEPTLIVLEATGGLEVRLAAALAAAALPVAVVNPRQVRSFAGDGPAGQDRPSGCRGDRSFRRGGPATGASLAGSGDPPSGCSGGPPPAAARDAGGRAQPASSCRSCPARADRRPSPLAGERPGRDRRRPRRGGPGQPDV